MKKLLAGAFLLIFCNQFMTAMDEGTPLTQSNQQQILGPASITCLQMQSKIIAGVGGSVTGLLCCAGGIMCCAGDVTDGAIAITLGVVAACITCGCEVASQSDPNDCYNCFK